MLFFQIFVENTLRNVLQEKKLWCWLNWFEEFKGKAYLIVIGFKKGKRSQHDLELRTG